MRQDYKEGMRFKHMNHGRAGVILRAEKQSFGVYHYVVLLDGETVPQLFNWNEIAPEDHPWHEKMKEWRAEGLRRGFTSIVIGTSKTGYRVFYCNNSIGYNNLVRDNPEIRMQYYWRL